MTRKEHHVVPNPNGGWDVKANDADRASKHFDTKQEAVDWGRIVSSNANSEFIIHRQDGTIQNADSHGNDPNPPKDTK